MWHVCGCVLHGLITHTCIVFFHVCVHVCALTFNRGDITVKTPSEHMEQRTTGIYCTNAGLGGGFGTSTNRWTSSGNYI